MNTGFQQNFGIAGGIEYNGLRLQLVFQHAEVVDLAVVTKTGFGVRVDHWLMRGIGQAEYAQSAMDQADVLLAISAGIVRTTMQHIGRQLLQAVGFYRLVVEVDDASYFAHFVCTCLLVGINRGNRIENSLDIAWNG